MPDSAATLTATAARRLVEMLVTNGIGHVFCVPGESYLAVLDAFTAFGAELKVISCRHEAGAANMAAAYGKLTGRPGVCFVTRGPGATQGSVGVHTAFHDSAPMLFFIGQIARGDRGRGAFQEVDYGAMFGPLSKLAVELDDPTRTVELAGRAIATAVQGRQGPVVVALSEDMLTGDAGAARAKPVVAAQIGFGDEARAAVAARLSTAERPLLILGGSGWSEPALAAITAWAGRSEMPIVLSFRRKDLLDNDHPCYVGDLPPTNPKLAERIRASDLVIALGARLGEFPTQGYTLFTPEETARKLIHIYPDPNEINRVWPASFGLVADAQAAALGLTGITLRRSWAAWRADARADYEAYTAPIATAGAVNPSEVFSHLAKVLPADAIVCNGAGNYSFWLHRFYRHRRFGTQLAPTSGAMGFGFPAGIAAKAVYPERTVVTVSGDGCFLMSSQEMATAVQYGINVVSIVVDNGSYGTIRMHQERHYPGRISATDLRNPDFAAFARSFGAWGATVARTDEFPDALDAALHAGQPALIHLKTSVEDILPGQRLSRISAAKR